MQQLIAAYFQLSLAELNLRTKKRDFIAAIFIPWGPGTQEGIPPAIFLCIPAHFIDLIGSGCAGAPTYVVPDRFSYLIHRKQLRLAGQSETLQSGKKNGGDPRLPPLGPGFFHTP